MRARTESGQSIKSYCERIGIHQNVYFYWQRKLREAAAEAMVLEQGLAVRSGLGFAEVSISEQSTGFALPSANHPSQISIESGVVRITTDSAYPPEQLAVLIRELSK